MNMPIVSSTPLERFQKVPKVCYELLEKCEEALEFRGKDIDSVYVYKYDCVHYETESGAAEIAIARFDDIYAIWIPKYLRGKQFEVLEKFLEEIGENEKIVTFSKLDYKNEPVCQAATNMVSHTV